MKPKRVDGGVYLTLSTDFLFSAGSTGIYLQEAQKSLLDTCLGYINSFNGSVSLNGHSDNVPIRSPIFPSNYELTGYRTSFFLRYMLSNGLDYESGNVSTLFWGDRLPYKALDFTEMPNPEQIDILNKTPEDRADNRRIDIYFYY
ncbi:MAG: hypothetical protein H8E26_14885 [FCB group bacterium]|nr:hypothetical protein [FCB group bacterium]MBL7029065.1 hypothetical protein [Candidatus Neomarinimicrobiota bacterium]MBL7122545.1 hypothetical protein [Candidatus Neomarinimicrobiota bacterium]